MGLQLGDVIMAPYIPAGVPSGCQYDIASTIATVVLQHDTIRAPGYISATACRVMISMYKIPAQLGKNHECHLLYLLLLSITFQTAEMGQDFWENKNFFELSSGGTK